MSVFSELGTACLDASDVLHTAGTSILDKNALTSAGVLVAAGTGVAGTALLVTALPAQMALAAGASAGLIYAGDRQDKGLPILPWQKGDEQSAPAAEAVVETTAAA